MNTEREKMYKQALMLTGVAFNHVCKLMDRKVLSSIETQELRKAKAMALEAHNIVLKILNQHMDDNFINTITNPNIDDVKRILTDKK